MELPANVVTKGRTYWFIKSWPSSVKNLAPTAKFRVSLGIKTGASETAIKKAALEAQESFDRQVSRLNNSDMSVTSELVTDKEARALISLMGLSERRFDPSRLGFKGHEDFNLTPEQYAEMVADMAGQFMSLADQAIDDMEDVSPEVKRRALEMLGKPKRKGPRFLSELWPPYCKRQGWDMTSKSGKEKQANWERAMDAIGDHPLVSATDDEINRGFREVIDDVTERGLKPHTATRYLSDVRACFIDAANRYDLKWVIRSNSSGKRKSQKVITATATEKQMITIAKACIERDDVHGVIGLMWLHGVSPEEIAGITKPETIKERIPHVIIMDGKTKDRPRVVVPSFGVKVLRKHLEATIEHCQRTVDSGANFNKWVKKLKGVGPDITGRTLRHGVRNAFVMTGQNNGIMKAALGWSGGDQTLAMHYGATGVGQSKFIKALKKAFDEAHAPIIKALK